MTTIQIRAGELYAVHCPYEPLETDTLQQLKKIQVVLNISESEKSLIIDRALLHTMVR